MPYKLLSLAGILVAAACLWVATTRLPGGYDWGRDYISTLLRGPAGPERVPAIAGVLLFCTGTAFVFERLSRAVELAKNSKLIRIAGIGSQVYMSLTVTPMHDLMVTISFVFLTVAILALIHALYVGREVGFFVAGCVCLAALVVSAAIYYSGYFVAALPWTQKAWLALFAVWVVGLDFRFPRARQSESAAGKLAAR